MEDLPHRARCDLKPAVIAICTGSPSHSDHHLPHTITSGVSRHITTNETLLIISCAIVNGSLQTLCIYTTPGS